MALKAHFYKHTLNFSFEAGTSRGVLTNKESFFIKVFDESNPEVFGLGEASTLKGLSIDFALKAEEKLQHVCNQINNGEFFFNKNDYQEFPSVLFALEMALRDFENNGRREIFANPFYRSNQEISINGLVWMGSHSFMKEQIIDKIKAGFSTIKLKIGAINFEEELDLLQFIRKEFKSEKLTLRVDANGAFAVSESLEKLNRLSEFDIHSIEQPIKQGQEEEMAVLCLKTPIPIALDEELISNHSRRNELLDIIRPQYIILKPSLMGGFSGSDEWILAAENRGINWWITSALESNIGLNAICQFTAKYDNALPQGLGTGKLYTNNFDSPLEIHKGNIVYNHALDWNLSYFD